MSTFSIGDSNTISDRDWMFQNPQEPYYLVFIDERLNTVPPTLDNFVNIQENTDVLTSEIQRAAFNQYGNNTVHKTANINETINETKIHSHDLLEDSCVFLQTAFKGFDQTSPPFQEIREIMNKENHLGICRNENELLSIKRSTGTDYVPDATLAMTNERRNFYPVNVCSDLEALPNCLETSENIKERQIDWTDPERTLKILNEVFHAPNNTNNSLAKESKNLNQYPNNQGKNNSKQCAVCQKSFSSLKYLRQHKQVHNSERPFSCDLCRYRFKRKDHLKDHYKIHRIFSCNMCNKIFSLKTDLVRHLRTHSTTQDCPYTCDICDARFKNKKYMKKHRAAHQKEFNCKICSKNFQMQQHLMKHLKIHSNERPYTCNLCPSKFKLPGGLWRHNKIHIRNKILLLK